MKAVLLAGGAGSRLTKYSPSVLKPLTPIAGIPIIRYVVKGLVSCGVKEFIVAGGAASLEICRSLSGDRMLSFAPAEDISRRCCVNHSLIGCARQLDSPFFLVHADIIVPISTFAGIKGEFETGPAYCLTALSGLHRIGTHPYVRLGKGDRVIEMVMKRPRSPSRDRSRWLCWMGVAILHPRLISRLEGPRERCGVPEATMADELSTEVVRGMKVEGYWFHLAYKKDMEEANRGIAPQLLDGYRGT